MKIKANLVLPLMIFISSCLDTQSDTYVIYPVDPNQSIDQGKLMIDKALLDQAIVEDQAIKDQAIIEDQIIIDQIIIDQTIIDQTIIDQSIVIQDHAIVVDLGGRDLSMADALIYDQYVMPNMDMMNTDQGITPCSIGRGVCYSEGVLIRENLNSNILYCNAPIINGVDELCDTLDNDCDGLSDEDFDLGQDLNHCGACFATCQRANASSQCVQGICMIDRCMMGFENTDQIDDNGCETAVPIPESCNFRDDDLDGIVDESKVCGPLLASSCQVTMGHTKMENHFVIPIQRWLQASTGLSCPSSENLTTDPMGREETCASTGGDSRFHPFTLYGTLNTGDLLGLKFDCQPSINADENLVIDWVRENCFVAFAIGNAVSSMETPQPPDRCTTHAQQPLVNYQCIKSKQAPNTDFSTLSLNDIDSNSRFAIAFSCQEQNNGLNDYGRQIQKSIEFFYGIQLKNNGPLIYPTEFDPPFNRCPMELEHTSLSMVNGLGHICMGTYSDQSWHSILLGNQRTYVGRDYDQMLIGLFATPAYR